MSQYKIYFLFILYTIPSLILGQNTISTLTDSLITSQDSKQIVHYSFKIASKLKFEDKERTKHYIHIAKQNTEKINTPEAWKTYYKNTARIYFEIDDLDLFTESVLKEYAYYKNTTEDRKYELENQLAILYTRLNDKDLALLYFNKLLQHHESNKNNKLIAQTRNNIGKLYLDYGFPKKALPYFYEALKHSEHVKDTRIRLLLLTNIGNTNIELNETDKAIKYLKKALTGINTQTDDLTKSWINRSLSEAYIQKTDADNAILHAKEAEKYDQTQNTFTQKELKETLYKAYLIKKDYKKASEYFVKYDAIRSNLKIESKAVNVEKIKIDYNNKIKTQQFELLNNKKRFSLIITICILVILLLILSIIVIHYKNRLINIKLEKQLNEYREIELKQQLEIRNKELAIKTIKETEQKELFKFLIDDLKKIQADGNQDTKNSVTRVINIFNQNEIHNNWEEFELRFSNVYESFYEKLNMYHPNLSVLDKRICALIKLDLSTKEIANITKSSLRSIENIRTRLRKKLGLTNSKTDLNRYFTELDT